MDPVNELVRLAINQGGWAVIAVLVFLAYRKDVKGTADVVVQLTRENTAALTELASLVRAMHNRLEPEKMGRTNARREG